MNSNFHPVKVVAVTGGKGGVGKTNVAVNLSLALAKLGRRVVLLDADLGLANVDVLLGLSSRYNLADMLSGKCSLREVMIEVAPRMKIVPAASGVQEMTALQSAEHRALIDAFSEIAEETDVLVVDTAAGISSSVISFLHAAQEVLAVVCNEPSSVTDVYALIKLLNRDYQMDRFRIVTNMTRSHQEAVSLFNNLVTVTDRFIDVTLQHIGNIPYDEVVRKAVRRQRPLLEYAPRSQAAQAFKKLAENVDSLPIPAIAGGHLEFFMDRLIEPASMAH